MTMNTRRKAFAFVLACLSAAACGGKSSSPGAPSAGAISVTDTPNPVPFSGTPIAGCVGAPNTWFYAETIRETGGVAVTLTKYVTTLDGQSIISQASLNEAIPANGIANSNIHWCLTGSDQSQHTLQTTLSVTDANGNSFSYPLPVVTLLANGTTPTPTPSSYAVAIASASCQQTAKRTQYGTNYYTFAISAAGTATAPDAGAVVGMEAWTIQVSTLSCGAWTPEISNDPLSSYTDCRRASASQATSTSWNGTFSSNSDFLNITDSDLPLTQQLRVTLYDQTGGIRGTQLKNVTCNRN